VSGHPTARAAALHVCYIEVTCSRSAEEVNRGGGSDENRQQRQSDPWIPAIAARGWIEHGGDSSSTADAVQEGRRPNRLCAEEFTTV